MAVRAKNNISGSNVAGFCHKLVANTVRTVHMLKTVFCGKCISGAEVARVVHLTCGDEMVVYKNRLISIPELCESHFLEFFCDERNKDVVYHYPVGIYGNDIARLNIAFICIMLYNFFYKS